MKSKQITLTISFLIFSFFLVGQDKYEFIVIEYDQYDREVVISVDGKEVLKEEVKVDNAERYSANPLLKRVSLYQDKGWEVIHFSNSVVNAFTYYSAYLRKKKST